MARNSKRNVQTEEPADIGGKIWPGPKVDYNCGYCPNCGSARNRILHTRPADRLETCGSVTREHECFACRTRFLSIQRIPLKDVEYMGGESGQ